MSNTTQNNNTNDIHYLGGCRWATIDNSVDSIIQVSCPNCTRIMDAQLNNDTPKPSDMGGGKQFVKEALRKVPEWNIYGIKAKSASQLIKVATTKVLSKDLTEVVLIPRQITFTDLNKLSQSIDMACELISSEFMIELSVRYKKIGELTGFKLKSNVQLKWLPTMAIFLGKLVNIAYFSFLSLDKFNQMLRNQTNPSQRSYRSVLTALYTGEFIKFSFDELFNQKKGLDVWQLKVCGNYHAFVKNCSCGVSGCQFVLTKPVLHGTKRYIAESELIQ